MMKIKVNELNKELITKAISLVEGKSNCRTMDNNKIIDLIFDIETKLKGIMKKSGWVGLIFDIDYHGQSFASSYKFIPESTHIRLERFTSYWAITGISRQKCGGCTQRITPVNISLYNDKITDFLSKSKNWLT